MRKLARSGLLPLLLLGACAVGPHYAAPTPPAAPGLASNNAPASSTPLSRVEETPVDLATWWRAFRDPRLDSLVDRALAANLDRAHGGVTGARGPRGDSGNSRRAVSFGQRPGRIQPHPHQSERRPSPASAS